MRKSNLSLLILLCTMTFAPMNVFAATYSTEIANCISVGDINIEIEESEDTINNNVVLPGQKIEKRISVKNNANKAWVRAKIEYSDCGGLKGISENEIEIASSKWKKVGEYYYHLEPIEKGSTVDLIKSVRVPSDWGSELSGEKFSIYISVDAVQFANFTPNFESTDPWFGTVIEECVHSVQDTRDSEKNKSLSLIFDNESRELIRAGDEFFGNWDSIMPGDTVSGKITIGNNYDRPVYMYFFSESTMDDDLASKLTLTIMNGDKELYNGPLNGIRQDIELGMFLKGNTQELIYTISVPETLSNGYTFSDTNTKWIFTCSYNEHAYNGGSRGKNKLTPHVLGENKLTPQQTESAENETEESTEVADDINGQGRITNIIKRIVPATGDTSQMMLYFWSMVFFGVSAVAMIIYNWQQNRRNKR